MGSLRVSIELPEELIERAKAVGFQIEDQTGQIVDLLEAQIRRMESGQRLRDVMNNIDSLPDSEKPSLEEIGDEIRVYRMEQSANNNQEV
jgi:hypothetical protein